ncbi:MAG: HPP family protein [Chloroflexota bacterium]
MATSKRAGVQERLHSRMGNTGDTLYMFTTVIVAVTISGLAAHFAEQPLLFPSLGPTALLLFERPLSIQASPRNTLIGHLVGILAGAGALATFGLLDAPSVIQEGVTFPRIAAAALSLAVTGAILLLARAQHPPAGATTLLVSLGLLTSLAQMISVAIGVLLLTVSSWLINRALGIPVPAWAPDERE